jgi:hypothetical protein
MNDLDAGPEREEAMRHDGLLVGIAGLGLVNGLHTSPFFDAVFILLRPFAPVFFASPVVIFYLTSLLLATFTIMLAGIPAAIYERANGLTRSDQTSLSIWLGALALLSLPSFATFLGLG